MSSSLLMNTTNKIEHKVSGSARIKSTENKNVNECNRINVLSYDLNKDYHKCEYKSVFLN